MPVGSFPTHLYVAAVKWKLNQHGDDVFNTANLISVDSTQISIVFPLFSCHSLPPLRMPYLHSVGSYILSDMCTKLGWNCSAEANMFNWYGERICKRMYAIQRKLLYILHKTLLLRKYILVWISWYIVTAGKGNLIIVCWIIIDARDSWEMEEACFCPSTQGRNIQFLFMTFL